MRDITNVADDHRLSYIREQVSAKPMVAIFQSCKPSEEQLRKMTAVNDLYGDKQPKGQLDSEAYREKGWYGRSLLPYRTMLEDPISDEQHMRMWLCAKSLCTVAKNRRHGA